MSRLPPTARINTTPESRRQEVWTVEMELLALNAELTSIAASGQQLKKPIKIPRPKRGGKQTGAQYAGDVPRRSGNVDAPRAADPYKRAVAVLAATTRGAVHKS